MPVCFTGLDEADLVRLANARILRIALLVIEAVRPKGGIVLRKSFLTRNQKKRPEAKSPRGAYIFNWKASVNDDHAGYCVGYHPNRYRSPCS